MTFTTGALAWFAPVYFTHGINSHNVTCMVGDPDWDPAYESPINVEDVSFFVGVITCLGGLHTAHCVFGI